MWTAMSKPVVAYCNSANAKFCKGIRSFYVTISVDYSVCNKNRVTAQEFVVRSYFSFPTVHKMMLKTCLMQSSLALRPYMI